MDTRSRAARRLTPARGLPLAAAATVLGVWSAATVVFDIDPFFLPSPADIAAAMARLPAYLAGQAWATILVTVAGFAVAAAGGLVVAIAVAASRHVEATILPLLVAANAIPKVAIAPLLVVWLGFGPAPKIILVATLCFFPIVVAAATGLTATPAELAELSRSLCAKGWQTFIKIRLPWALPQVFVGLKVASTLAVIGAVVAELANPNQGLGSVIVRAGASADTPLAFAAIILLALLSVSLYYLVALAERILLPWAKETTG